MTCPDCGGAGSAWLFVDYAEDSGRQSGLEYRPCGTCDGTGRIDAALAARLEAGRRLQRDRVARGVTLRDEAARLGISIVALSKRERGREDAR